jgi:hypothetical protein
MNGRKAFGALLGAGILALATVGTATAAPKTYTISAWLTASPDTVPSGGGSVTFTLHVTNTGTGDFNGNDVVFSDDDAGCTLTGLNPTGPSDKLNSGETWTWSCTVANVAPNTTNTAHIDVCHNGGGCGNAGAQATSADPSIEIGLSGGTNPGDTGAPPTDTLTETGTSGPSQTAWLLVVALGALLGSLVILRPARSTRSR